MRRLAAPRYVGQAEIALFGSCSLHVGPSQGWLVLWRPTLAGICGHQSVGVWRRRVPLSALSGRSPARGGAPLRRLAARRIAGQAEISPRGAAALPGGPSQGWPRTTNPRRDTWTSRREPATALRDFECADRSQPCEGATSPCEGWLDDRSSGKPRSPFSAFAPYTAGLRKVGWFCGDQPSQGFVDISPSACGDVARL